MTDGPDERPPGGARPAPAVSIRLGLLASTREALGPPFTRLRAIVKADNRLFDEGPPERQKDPGKGTVSALHRKSFPQGTLFRRVTVATVSATRVTATTDCWVEGEGDRPGEALRACALGTLRAQWALVRRADADAKCRPTLLARFRGSLGGAAFGALLQEQGLGVPILVRTDVDGYPDGFLAGLDVRLGDRVLVAELDSAAAARLTDLVGRGMSCFNGSARVYHPGWSGGDDPGRHAIWRRREILREGEDVAFAEHTFRDRVVREVFTRPRERDHRRMEGLEGKVRALEERVGETASELAAREDDVRQAAAGLKGAREEIDDLKGERDRLKKESRDEKGRLQREIRDLRSRPGSAGRTVQEAVEWVVAMLDGKEHALVFGERVPEGVKRLNPDAGPPEKVLHYLIQLGEFAREMRTGGGSVGKSMVDWFRERDCEVSPESETTQEMYPREFPVNGKRHRFDWHMKPNNLPGAKGVRIHFKWDPDSGKVLVGWVGRHRRTRSYGTQ